MRKLLFVVCLIALALGACSEDPTDLSGGSTTTTSTTVATTAGEGGRVVTKRIGDFDQPLALAVREGTIYVGEKGGKVKTLAGKEVLDIGDEVSTGSEQGLLGIAFSPDGQFLYVNFTNESGDTRVVEFAMTGETSLDDRRQVLAVDQPYANHNGGHLAFGPDGYLYIGLGDGGSGGDPQGNGQNPRTLLGKMLRIDPRPSGGEPYTVPEDNPFVDGGGGARPEIWALGLRNPWRYSFDRTSGDLWIGDVGQNSREEINHVEKGASARNYGWNLLEGNQRFRGSPPENYVAPVHDYATGGGTCAVTGGIMYRGRKVTPLVGAYVFADVCEGRLKTLRMQGGTASVQDLDLPVPRPASFGEDAGGEVLIASLEGGVYRLELE